MTNWIALKLYMADEIFNPGTDEKIADSLAKILGLYESRLEFMRYKHFRALVNICNNEQREKLRPIIKELYSKKGQKDKPAPTGEPGRMREPEKYKEKNRDREPKERLANPPKVEDERQRQNPPTQENRPAPPNSEEKLNRYTEKLSLTPVQIMKVKEILSVSRKKGEALRSKRDPDPSEIEREKEKIRNEEDGNILQILNPEQKTVFEKMIGNRGKK